MAAPATPAPLADVLRGALSLSAQEQASLRAVLQRLADTDGEPEAREDPVADTARVTQAPAPSTVSVQHWLQRIAPEPAWLQLALLEDALESCETQEEYAALDAARTRLLRAQLPLALRLRVTELASVHPLRVGAAAVGLLLGLAGLGRSVLHALF